MHMLRTGSVNCLLFLIILYITAIFYYSKPSIVLSRDASFIPTVEHQSNSSDFCAKVNSKLNQFSGRFIEYEVKRGDTLTGIASKLGSVNAVIQCLNPTIEKEDFIVPGERLRIIKGELHVEVDLSKNMLAVFIDEIILKHYLVATGRGGIYESPTGQFRIRDIVWHPYDYKSMASFLDSKNRFGNVWLSLDIPEYGIHGTNEPHYIGQSTSNGCIRMFNDDIEELAKLVSIGTRVNIIR